MRVALIALTIAALFCVAAADDVSAETQFLQFMAKYNKTYTSEVEWSLRYNVFVENLARIEALRQEHFLATGESGEEVYGVTKFADLSRDEFKRFYLNYKPSDKPRSHPVSRPLFTPEAIPNSFDWRSKKVVTPVKDQAQCGSCWAFSATEEIESSWAMEGNALTELSVQQIVSCDTVDQGCNGGDTTTAYDYVKKAGGLELDSKYPYTSGGGDSGTCEFKKADAVITLTNYSYATPPCTDSCNKQNEELMLTNLVSYGPVSICVYAEPWQLYTGGILSSGCPHAYSDLDHCVQLVGYDLSGTPYVAIRNSWSADWGIDGYIHVKYGSNLCGIADEATLVKTAKA